MPIDSIPFHFNPVHGGLSSCSGLLQVKERSIRCEFRYDIGGLGLKTGVKELEIDFDEITSLEYRGGWLGGKVILRAVSLKSLERFPSSEENQVIFHIRRRDRRAAEIAIGEASYRLAEMGWQKSRDGYSPA